MAKVTRKEITTTNAWVNSSLAIDPSTAAIGAAYPLDEIEIDSSIPSYKRYERLSTHLLIDYNQLDIIAPQDVSGAKCINDILLEELIDQLSSGDPYKKYRDRLLKAKQNFNK